VNAIDQGKIARWSATVVALVLVALTVGEARAEAKPGATAAKAAPGKFVVGGRPGATMKSARLQKLQSLVDSKEWLKDPFRNLHTQMGDVISDLADGETTTPAESTEPRIISRLDVLIEMLERQCKAGKGGGNPNSPLRRSVLAGGPGGQGDLNAPRRSNRKWAELTAKERERMLQSRTEGFPAGYEEILGEYYRRLATEESVRAIAPGSAKGNEAAPPAGKKSP
jgi:hypothetical protein